MTFKIEHNIPAPTFHGPRVFPFNEMKPGDSFLVNGFDPKRVATAAISFGKSGGRGWKFSTRKTPEGYRCWRIS